MRVFVFLVILGVLMFPSEVIIAGREGIELSFFRVIPSLFPFIVLQNFSVKIGLTDTISKILSPLRLFKMKEISPFVLGVLGGYPIGAKALCDMVENKKISVSEAERCIGFCNNAGPAFVIGYVGISLFNSKEFGYILLIAHILSAVIVGIIFSIFTENTNVLSIRVRRDNDYIKSFINSVNDGFKTSISITAFITFTSVFVEILKCFHIFNTISSAISPMVSINKDVINSFLIGLFELTNGINELSFSGATIEQKLVISSALLSLGGLSITLQTMLFTKKLKLFNYFKTKIISSLISPILAINLYRFLPLEVSLFYNKVNYIEFLHISIICFLILVASFILKKRQNNCKNNFFDV